MQQRRLRLGDILDDYCPRERRITNHAVVAMIEDEVKQTRCTTCNADHEYKAAKVPPPRRKRPDAAAGDSPEGLLRPRAASEDAASKTLRRWTRRPARTRSVSDVLRERRSPATPTTVTLLRGRSRPPVPTRKTARCTRRLIRATLPRPEGQAPERKALSFTIRPARSARPREFDGNKTRGQRFGQGRAPCAHRAARSHPRFGGAAQWPRPVPAVRENSSGQGRPQATVRRSTRGPRGNRPGGGGRKRGR